MILLWQDVRRRIWLAGPLACGVVLLAVWGYAAFPREDPLRLEVAVPSLEEVPTGALHPAELVISNPHARPVRLVGMILG